MKYYVIINGVSSETIQGLAIESLPAISKPLQRSKQETIDGRDGDIITKLGYSAYDKTLKIGLWGNYDIDEVIKYFDSEGTITFSNEPDMYYNFNILNRIDFINQLEAFRKATITIHCQPFKYKEEETQTLELEEHQATGTDFNLDGTYATSLGIDLKGNTDQVQLTGKNKIGLVGDSANNVNGIVNNDGTITISGTSNITDGKVLFRTTNKIVAGTYTLTISKALSYVINLTLSAGVSFRIPAGSKSATTTLTNDYESGASLFVSLTNGTTYNDTFNIQLTSGSTADYDFEKYCGGVPSPNPDYPQQVQVVSGNNTITICGKNLFDKDTIISGKYINASGNEGTDNTAFYSNYIPITPNTDYTISGRTLWNSIAYYDKNKTFIERKSYNQTNLTINITNTNICYMIINASLNDVNTLQLEKSNQATTYEAYQSQTYPINLLVDMELCKIGNYQDSFVYDDDKWYLHKEIGKVVLDGSETGWNRTASTMGYYSFYKPRPTDSLAPSQTYYCNYFKSTMSYASTNNSTYIGNTNVIFSNVLVNGEYLLLIDDFKTWLSTHNTIVYYVLATPTNTEITDTTLINQLNAIKEATSYNGTTNILQENNDLPFILDIDYITGTNEITITNNGNTYSKPVLTLVGSGVIGIYLNDTQIFQVSLGTNETIIIDTDKMEAYYESTLKNRQVIGDYNNFRLIAGENKIKLTGNWDKLSVDNYSRWI